MNQKPVRGASSTKYDAVIIGGGHNGLVASYYLANAGKKTLVLEQRDKIGGAAISEEIVKGYIFSRTSYLFSLFRPQILEDLRLKERGLKLFLRNPSSFTPMKDGRYLLMGNAELNKREIAKFSEKDAENFHQYEQYLEGITEFFEPLFDEAPIDFKQIQTQSGFDKIKMLMYAQTILKRAKKLGYENIPQAIELLAAPTTKILNNWFESEPLKSTLATDAIIGAMTSPEQPGSAYVLLHHVMGQSEGLKGAWAYVEGGMGSVSQKICEAAKEKGVEVRTSQKVKRIVVDPSTKQVTGVELASGEVIESRIVLSNATAYHTYMNLVDKQYLDPQFYQQQKSFDYDSPVFKINIALNHIPEFKCIGKKYAPGEHGPEHCGTIHLGAESLEEIHQAYLDATVSHKPSTTPVIEMTIPSVYDKSLILDPENKNKHHVVGLFVQYAPYNLPWEDADFKQSFVDRVFNIIEIYAPGFKKSIIGYEALSPKDIERIFGLTKGNIFQGALSLDQLYFNRPNYRSPLKGLYICGSSAHPGGGVTGAPGRNCSVVALQDL